MAVGLPLVVLLALLGPLCSLGGHDSHTKDVCDDGKVSCISHAKDRAILYIREYRSNLYI